MSSLQIAEITGKDHRNVMRDIRETLEQAGIGPLKFEQSYLNTQNKPQPCYHLPRRECDLVIRNTLEQAEIDARRFAGNFREALKFQESYKDAFGRWRGGAGFPLSENNKSPILPCLVSHESRWFNIGPHSQPRGHEPRSGTPPEI